MVADEAILKAIYDIGIDMPSQIQCRAIPLLAGSPPASLIAQSPFGSGRIVAFLTSMLLPVDRRVLSLQGILLTHTIELTDQIFKVAMAMNAKLDLAIGWAANREYEVCRHMTPQILIGTPSGVLRNILKRRIETTRMQFVIVDEADKLLNCAGGTFVVDIEMLIGRTSIFPHDIAVGFFSASFSDTVQHRVESETEHLFNCVSKDLRKSITWCSNICKACSKQSLPSRTSGLHKVDSDAASTGRFWDIATNIKWSAAIMGSRLGQTTINNVKGSI
jgi:ATP-dependent RNA helicase DeaD